MLREYYRSSFIPNLQADDVVVGQVKNPRGYMLFFCWFALHFHQENWDTLLCAEGSLFVEEVNCKKVRGISVFATLTKSLLLGYNCTWSKISGRNGESGS